jgi:hypothetical protein
MAGKAEGEGLPRARSMQRGGQPTENNQAQNNDGSDQRILQIGAHQFFSIFISPQIVGLRIFAQIIIKILQELSGDMF